MRWVGHVTCKKDIRNVYKQNFGLRTEGKKPFGRPRYMLRDNSEIDLKEIGCKDVNWIGLAQNRSSGRLLSTW
jgi:hypothetical protein